MDSAGWAKWDISACSVWRGCLCELAYGLTVDLAKYVTLRNESVADATLVEANDIRIIERASWIIYGQSELEARIYNQEIQFNSWKSVGQSEHRAASCHRGKKFNSWESVGQSEQLVPKMILAH